MVFLLLLLFSGLGGLIELLGCIFFGKGGGGEEVGMVVLELRYRV